MRDGSLIAVGKGNPFWNFSALQAYTPQEDIIYGTDDTMDIVAHIKPIYNFKASENFHRKK